MGAVRRGFLDNEKFLDIAIKTMIALVIITAASYIGVRYYFDNVKIKEQLPAFKAMKELEAEVRKNPLNINARLKLASAYNAVQKYPEAIQQCLEVLKVDKENQAALTMAGFAYMQKGDYDNALKMYQKEIDAYSGAGFALENKYLEEAYFNSGVIYWKKKDLDKALYHVHRAALIRRTDADVFFFLGRLYYEKKLYVNAERYFQQALRFVPNYVDAHLGLAKAYEKMGLLGMAINQYERTYSLNPKIKEAKKKSNELFVKLKEKAGKSPTVENLVQLGLAHMGRRDFVAAYKVFKKALDLDSNNAEVHYAFAYALEREWALQKDDNKVAAEKLKSQAESHYNKALAIDPDYEGAKAGLKRLQLGVAEEEFIKRDVKVGSQ